MAGPPRIGEELAPVPHRLKLILLLDSTLAQGEQSYRRMRSRFLTPNRSAGKGSDHPCWRGGLVKRDGGSADGRAQRLQTAIAGRYETAARRWLRDDAVALFFEKRVDLL